MQTKTTFKFLSATLVSLVLAACGGGSGSALDNSQNQQSSSSINNSTLRIGSGTGSSFVSGSITSNSSATTLFEGDKTQLSVNIVDGQGALTGSVIGVKFDSPCLAAGLSTIAGDSTVNTINGTATVQYQVGKCDIDDKVTATIASGTSTIEASIVLPINTRRMGAGFGPNFINNELEIGIGETIISAGGSTSVTAYIVNSTGELVTDAMNITFSSPCISANNASITGGNIVTSVNGRADANYVSKGCAGVGGVDVIKATTTFRGNVLTATGNIFVKPDSAQTISFKEATPALVSIKGTGGQETSTLRFQVLGQTGNPVKGVCVNFAPNTTVGGLALVPSKCNPAGPETYGSSTDADGYVSTIVQAGTVATAVRVTATTANGISTQSSALAISTGIPDQNSMTISLSNIAPIAWDYNGVQSTVTIQLADAFNNPVPDNTIVAFTTNGGSIEPNCPTVGGKCTVAWTSQSPKPISTRQVSFHPTTFAMICPAAVDAAGNAITECRSGRVKILATAIGNESFIDGNGNGLYDSVTADTFLTHVSSNAADTYRNACNPSTPLSSAALGVPGGCDDLAEAYLDTNFNFARTSIEEFIDFNQNGIHDAANGKYDGALCSGTAKANGSCTTNKVTVRDDITLVMSCQSPFEQPANRLPGMPSTVSLGVGASTTISMLRADCNGNGMPAGTTVSVDTSALSDGSASVSPTGPSPMSREPDFISLDIASNAGKTASGSVKLSITAPAGIIGGALTTTYSIRVN